MSDFGALPPEINSARMYSGPGCAPMMAAATAWDALAGQLESFALGYSSALAELQGQAWSGSASAAMAGAATPYVAWAAATAAQAEQAAGQARAAAAAYEAAFAATVPPAVVAANRARLAILVATNFFGQNTPLIAATEAAYAEMWAQDAAAMFGYAASSAAAVKITPFHQPPRTVNAVGSAAAAHAHSVLSQLLSSASQQLHALSTAGTPSAATPGSPPVLTALSDFTTLSGPAGFGSAWVRTLAVVGDFVNEVNLYGFQAGNVAAAPAPAAALTATSTGGPVRGAVLANMGRAGTVGNLRIPPGWAATTPAAGSTAGPAQPPKTAFRALPSWAAADPAGGLGPAGRVAARPVGNAARRMRVRRYRIPRPAVGG